MMNEFLTAIDGFDPLIVWGLFTRMLGLVYLIAIAPLFHQVLPLGGEKGINPIKPLLKKIRQDYPSYKRFFYFPTLLWLNAYDWFLQALVVVGSVAALVVIYGGSYSWFALLICLLVYRSLDIPMGFAYPWDSLLIEAGFLALFLPTPHTLPDISLTQLPLPAVAWAFRWLIFRLILGFGKLKFWGTNSKDSLYIKSFLINQPMPTCLGWYAHRLPDWVLKLALAGMFLVEIPIPFMVFFTGYPRVFAALAIIGLMVGIQLTGNFGFFNILTITLCIPLFDSYSSIFNQPLTGIIDSWDRAIAHLVILILFVGGLLYFPLNSWCTQAWLYWPTLFQIRIPGLHILLNFYRALAPFRIIHAYGVFPPNSSPPVRWIPIIEGTHDGKEWKEYEYRFMTSSVNSPPLFVAPYHPRLDHAMFYEAVGTGNSHFLSSFVSAGNPYSFTRSSGLKRLVQRLLEGDSPVTNLFGYNPFPASDSPPIAVRVSCYMYQPTSHAERVKTGAWWTRQWVGTHQEVTTLDPKVWQEWLPEPELFHWDELIWKRRASKIKKSLKLVKAGGDPNSILVANYPSITAQDVNLFWQEFVPLVTSKNRNWENLPNLVEKVRSQYTDGEIRQFEKILGQLSIMLSVKLEPYFFGNQKPQIQANNYFQLGMLIHHIIGEGKDAYEDNCRNPAIASHYLETMTLETGMFFWVIFWYDVISFHARKFRLVLKIAKFKYIKGLPGFLELLPFIAQQLEDDEREKLPTFIHLKNGNWKIEN